MPTNSMNANEEHPPQHVETFRSDDPLTDPALDLFDRLDFARRIAHSIRERQDDSSLVIGIFGPWGDGKTTVLNFIDAALDDASAFTTVRFNPWLIGDENQLLPAFFATVSNELKVSPGGKRRKLADRLNAYGDALSAASIDIPVIGLDPGKAAHAAAKLLASSSLHQRRREFEEALRSANRHVVIFLDDIDRLDTREIRSIFRLIRLAAPFERVSYVVACDDKAVASALRDVHGGDDASGDDFLEKIVQVPLHIPPASSSALRSLAFQGSRYHPGRDRDTVID
jgi:predicted KAP-like P-loop ATPase